MWAGRRVIAWKVSNLYVFIFINAEQLSYWERLQFKSSTGGMVHNSPWWQCLNIEIELDKANFANSSLNKFRFLDEFAMVMVMMMASSKPGPSDKVGLSLCLKLDGKFIKPLDSVVATKSKSVESFSVKSFLSCCHKGRQWQPAMANCNQKSKQKGQCTVNQGQH